MRVQRETEAHTVLTPSEKRGRVSQVLKELNGQACHSCGTRRYYLVLRMSAHDEGGKLVARCSRCHCGRGYLSEELLSRDIDRTPGQWPTAHYPGPWKQVASQLS